MDFKNFCDKQMPKNPKEEKVYINRNEEDIKAKAKQSFEKYANYSNDELMLELINMTNQKRKDGTLDNQKMMDMYNAISSVLPQENKKNLDDIFNRLK